MRQEHSQEKLTCVTLQLPPCDADLVLQAVPATQLVPPRLLADVTSSGNKSRPAPAQDQKTRTRTYTPFAAFWMPWARYIR